MKDFLLCPLNEIQTPRKLISHSPLSSYDLLGWRWLVDQIFWRSWCLNRVLYRTSIRQPRMLLQVTEQPAAGANLEQALWEETWGDWEWRQHRILGPGARELPGRLDPRGQEKELARFGETSSGARREPAAVSGARIAAWLEAENALGNCLQR